MKSGIYKITHKPSGEFYIGASANLRTRRSQHLNQLRNSCSPHPRLQKRFLPFFMEDFDFEIVELCDPKALRKLEIKTIRKLRPSLNANVQNGRLDGILRFHVLREVYLLICEYGKQNGIKHPTVAARQLVEESLRAEGLLK